MRWRLLVDGPGDGAVNMAVDPAVILELGYNGRGTTAENHHVCPIHPEYAQLPPQTVDKDAALALLTEAGYADHVFEIVSFGASFQIFSPSTSIREKPNRPHQAISFSLIVGPHTTITGKGEQTETGDAY